jgi:hypothetical protein
MEAPMKRSRRVVLMMMGVAAASSVGLGPAFAAPCVTVIDERFPPGDPRRVRRGFGASPRRFHHFRAGG